jgi:transcriptional regulator with XRE-family HTH domain
MATKTLGQRIRELREQKDLSLRELAKKIGVSAAFLSDVELGRRYPSEKGLLSIAQKLETTLEDLREYDTRPPVEDLKRLAITNPLYGVAFRRMIDRVIDEKISPQDLIELAGKKGKRKKKS